MAKKTEEPDAGEQLDLIETQPENAKKLQRLARKYRRSMLTRKDATEQEVADKTALLEAIHEAEIVPDADGKFKIKCGKVTIKVTPRDELVQVKDEDESEE